MFKKGDLKLRRVQRRVTRMMEKWRPYSAISWLTKSLKTRAKKVGFSLQVHQGASPRTTMTQEQMDMDIK